MNKQEENELRKNLNECPKEILIESFIKLKKNNLNLYKNYENTLRKIAEYEEKIETDLLACIIDDLK